MSDASAGWPSDWPADLDAAWRPWHPDELARRLAGVGVAWWVCGGWALDLFRGRQTRAHDDLEFAVHRPDFGAVRDVLAADHDLYYVGPDTAVRLGPGETPPAGYDQVWTRDPATGSFRTDTFLDPGNADEWVSKRDERLRMPLADAVAHTEAGVPYQRPQIVLLMKAKHRRRKDEADLAATWPLLDEPARAWFRQALALVHPDHAWRHITA